MKNQIIILFLVCFTYSNLLSAQKNYIQYHQIINSAEVTFFISNDASQAIKLYDSAFKNYEFVFVKDCFIAAHIAWYNHFKPSFLAYCKKGFTYGLPLAMAINIVKPNGKDSLTQKSIISKLKELYELERPKYLRSINYTLLDKVYDQYAFDHVEKNKDFKIYEPQQPDILSRLKKMIEENGFPGEKQIGIEEKNIFKNLNSFRFWRNSNNVQHYSDSTFLCNEFPFPILVHIPCSYGILKDLLLSEMKKGNIHPRDISVLYDNTLRFRPNKSKIMKCDLNLSGYYQTNIFALNSYSKPPNYLAINKMRSDLYIVPLEVDEAKQKFCKDKNIKVWEFGFFGCR